MAKTNMKVLVTTIPYGLYDAGSLELLKSNNIDYFINPYNKKITEEQLADIIHEYDALIAGTETISEFVLSKAENLKIIARVGVGYNNIDLEVAKARKIKITYIPDGPDRAVADLTIGFMYTLLRSTHVSNLKMHQGIWERTIGRRLCECSIGILGAGKIGFSVAQELEKIGIKNIMLCDLHESIDLSNNLSMHYVDLDMLIKDSDIITLHLPMTSDTENMITKKELLAMKSDSCIINTSRGGIINEDDLYSVMNDGHLSGAAIDVFTQEPYSGKLTTVDRCLLTAHTASMTIDCRTSMEYQAVNEIIRLNNNEPLICEIPNY
jgi:D-3-phosphoglycerate dehydrogenase / 2-oxoglutarate reductase